ncbi:MAG: peptide chain release factor N(5)-glutamine methyltransferase [Winogradskyella sp.]|nr:peptide chain release factor N(5)-glutamine methyltransferase [Winogradskyella sp.]
MLLKDIQDIFHKELDALYGKDEVNSFFFLCNEYFLNLPRIELVLQSSFTLTKSETDIYFKVLEDLKQHKPIQYILGETEFFGLSFKVNKNVLIPRPETEELVALILENHKIGKLNSKALKILDIGTGSGCIAITLAKHLPNSKVYALDISKEAIEVAEENAKRNAVEITFVEMDILNETTWDLNFKNLEFDLIVSNPPYVRNLEKAEIQPNVLENEPHLALFVEDNNPLKFYKVITDFAINKLKHLGNLYFEINQYLGDETKELINEESFEAIELLKDLNGNDRMLKAIKK